MMCIAPSRARTSRSDAKASVRVAQVVKHARANDLVERLAKLPNPLDRKPVELQISYVVLLLEDRGCGASLFR